MKVSQMTALIDYLRTIPHQSRFNQLVACYDGYIALVIEREDVDEDIMYNLGFTWDKQNDWYAFDADRGV